MRILPIVKNCCKIKTYIRFAKKSRSIVLGTDDIAKAIKKCHLILVSNALAESSLSKIKQISEKFSKQLCLIDAQEIEDILESKSIKAVAITDKNLSDAIKNWL